MMHAKSVNVDKLQSFVKKNPKAEQALRILSKRQRGRDDTTFRRIKRLLDDGGAKDWTMEDLKSLFETLQDAGAGRIVFGAKTPRFVWDFHLQSVALAALGLPEPIRKRKNGELILVEGMRRPTPPRKELPRLTPVKSLAGHKKPVARAIAEPVQAAAGSQVITLRRNGIELEVDLEQVTLDGCRKLTQLLMSV